MATGTLPPGVPYERQQFAAFAPEVGCLDVPGELMASSPGRSGQRFARLTAETTARSDAATVELSMPTPHRTRSPTVHSR